MAREPGWARAAACAGLALLLPAGALAAGDDSGAAAPAPAKSEQPYIDYLKSKMKNTGPQDSESYIDQQKQKLEQKSPPPTESYIDYLKRTDPNAAPREAMPETYLEKQKKLLDQKLKPKSAIEAVKEGKSDLHAKMTGEIHHNVGLRIGASVSQDITASSAASARPFSEVYGTGWRPDVQFSYEYQPFHSEWVGSLGIFATLGLSYASGQGKFAVPTLKNPITGEAFGADAQTKFQFFSLPLSAGLNYRFNLLRYIRPYVEAAPSLQGYVESRSDNQKGNRGFSRGYFVGGGAAILLDWVSRSSMWELYDSFGIKHYYLTIDYMKVGTLSGDVTFKGSGVYTGFAFEF